MSVPAFGYVTPCYGGYILDKSAMDSNAMALLDSGINSLICSSNTVWNSIYLHSQRIDYGNRLAQIFFEERANCSNIGDFFKEIKLMYLEEIANYAQRDGRSYVEKSFLSLLEFNLLGDPSIKIEFNM